MPTPKWEETEAITPSWDDTYPIDNDSTIEKLANKGIDLLGGIGKGLETIESYTAAPIRAGIYAGQKGYPILESMKFQFGEDPKKAPSGKMIAKEMGFSEEPYIKTPLISNPWGKGNEEKYLSLSPAQIAGGVVTTITDPMTYAGELAIAKGLPKGAELTANILNKYKNSLAETAGKRAAKAAVGSNIAAQRDLVGITAKGAPDINAIKSKYRDLGERLLTPGKELSAEGKPIGKTVGWIAKTENVGNKSAEKFDYWKNKYNDFKKIVGVEKPISGENIADDLMKYAESLPVNEQTKTLKNRLYLEAENMMTANKNMSLDDAIKLKSSFKYQAQSPDAFTSSADVNNKIKSIIDDQIEKSLDDHILNSNPNKKILDEYKDMKKGYGIYKTLSSNATERMVRDVSNRLVSPSDYAAGAIGTIKEDSITGIIAAAANKIGREYGSSLGANTAFKLSKAAEAGSKAITKHANKLKAALQLGLPTYMVTIESLKNQDPEFKKALEDTK